MFIIVEILETKISFYKPNDWLVFLDTFCKMYNSIHLNFNLI